MALVYLPTITELNNGSNNLPVFYNQGDNVNTTPYGRGENMGQPGSRARSNGRGFRAALDGVVPGWSAYTIPVVPLPSAGLVASWDADTATNTYSTVNAYGSVTAWADTVSGFNLAPVGGTPIWYPNVCNGHAGVGCLDGATYLTNATVVIAQPFQLHLVLAQLDWSGLYIAGDPTGGASLTLGHYGISPQVGLYAGLGPTCQNGTVPLNGLSVINGMTFSHIKCVYNGINSSTTVGGITVTGSAGTNGLPAGLVLSAYGAGVSPTKNIFLAAALYNPAALGFVDPSAAFNAKYNLPNTW
jgi:hypothetical protein